MKNQKNPKIQEDFKSIWDRKKFSDLWLLNNHRLKNKFDSIIFQMFRVGNILLVFGW